MSTEQMPPPTVLVVWEDTRTHGDTTWIETKDTPYVPHLVHQVGFLLRDEPLFIRLTQAWHPEIMAPTDTIPRGCIRSMTYVAPAKLTKKRG